MKIWNFKTPLSFLASIVWNLSELFNIPLKRFAPTVFHFMIGAKGKSKLN